MNALKDNVNWTKLSKEALLDGSSIMSRRVLLDLRVVDKVIFNVVCVLALLCLLLHQCAVQQITNGRTAITLSRRVDSQTWT